MHASAKLFAWIALFVHSPRPDLVHTLQTWESRLRLTDWKITVETASDQTLGGAELGDIHWDLAARRASIRVLREEDYDLPPRLARLDQEATLVHELVHLIRAIDHRSESEGAVILETNDLLRANHEWGCLSAQEQ